jgi:hypothetical protein
LRATVGAESTAAGNASGASEVSAVIKAITAIEPKILNTMAPFVVVLDWDQVRLRI